MAKKIENIGVRRVGRGFIVDVSKVENEGTEKAKWEHKDEIFLDKKELKEFVDENINKI